MYESMRINSEMPRYHFRFCAFALIRKKSVLNLPVTYLNHYLFFEIKKRKKKKNVAVFIAKNYTLCECILILFFRFFIRKPVDISFGILFHTQFRIVIEYFWIKLMKEFSRISTFVFFRWIPNGSDIYYFISLSNLEWNVWNEIRTIMNE